MSKETAFYGKLAAMTDQWMDLFGYWAPLVVTDSQVDQLVDTLAEVTSAG